MKMLRVMCNKGDDQICFDETEATAEQKAKAKSIFDDWMAKKKAAFLTKRTGGQPDLKITSFDQIEDGAETILVPVIHAG